MKTGIIIYSQTGHTRQAAQRLRDALRNKGQECELLEVQVSTAKPEANIDKLQFTVKPSPELEFPYNGNQEHDLRARIALLGEE